MDRQGTALCNQPRRKNAISSCQDGLYASHDFFYRFGVGRRNDLETTITFQAVPKMNEVTFIPALMPVGKKQLVATLDTRHREFGTPIGCHDHYDALGYRVEVPQ